MGRRRSGFRVVLFASLAAVLNSLLAYAINQVDSHERVLSLVARHPVISVVTCTVLIVLVYLGTRKAEAAADRPDDPPPPALPEPPDWAAARPVEQAQVVAALRLEGKGPAPVVALHGPGGFGKSTLVDLITADPAVRKRLKNRVYRVTVGREADDATVAARVNDIAEMISGVRPGFPDPLAAGRHLGRLLDAYPRALLIIDDVWTEDQLAPFLVGGVQSPRLFTTRIADLGPGSRVPVSLGGLSADTSTAVLSDGLPALPTELLGDLRRATRQWPLVVRMVNRVLAAQIQTGAHPEEAARTLLRDLERVGPTAVDAYATGAVRPLAEAVIRTAAPLLPPHGEQRLAELAIFAEASAVPIWLVAQLWRLTAVGGQDESVSRDLCSRLARLSFVTLTPADGGTVKVHDEIRGLLLAQLAPDLVRELNRRLLDAVAPDGEWCRFAQAGGYLGDHLIRHLLWAGRAPEARALAADPAWIRARLIRYGPPAVLADLVLAGDPNATALRERIARIAHLLEPTRPPESVADVLAAHLGIDDGTRPHLRPSGSLPEPVGRASRILRGHVGAVVRVVIGPDESWLASAGSDGTVRVWDRETGAGRIVLKNRGAILDLSVSPDGSLLAVRAPQRIELLDASSGKPGRAFEVPGRTVAFTPDGKGLVTSAGGRYRVLDLGSGEVIATRGEHSDRPTAVAVDAVTAVVVNRPPRRGRHFKTPGKGTVAIWQADSRRPVQVLEGHTRHINSVAFLGGGLLATAGSNWTVRVFDVVTGKCHLIGTGHEGPVRAIARVGANDRFVTGGQDGTVRLWSVGSPVPLAIVAGAPGGASVDTVAVAPSGAWLGAGDHDGDILLRDLSDDRLGADQHLVVPAYARYTNAIPGHYVVAAPIVPIAAVPGGPVFAVARANRLRVWDLGTDKRLQDFSLPGAIAAMVAAPDGSWIAVSYGSAEVAFYEPPSGRRVRTLRTRGASCMALSGDGAWMATAVGDAVELWDGTDFHKITAFRTEGSHINALSAAPDGSWLAMGGERGAVTIWDVRSETSAATLVRHVTPVDTLAASADSRRLISGDRSGVAYVWEVASGEVVAMLRGSDKAVRAVLLSGRGSWAVTGGSNRIVRIWNVDSGGVVAELPGFDESVAGLAMPPKQDLLIGVSTGNSGLIWRTASLWSRLRARSHQPSRQISALADGRDAVFAASHDGTVSLLAANAEEPILAHCGPTTAVAVASNDRWVATGDRDGMLTLWDRDTGDWRERFRCLPDGYLQRTRANGEKILLQSTRPVRHSRNVDVANREIRAVCAAPDDSWVAWIAPGAAFVHLWRIGDETLTTLRVRKSARLGTLAVAPDGTWLALAGIRIELYRPGQDVLETLTDGPLGVRALAVSPHGDILYAADRRWIRSWTLADGQARSSFAAHADAVQDLAVSPDGKLLASVSRNGELIVWRDGTPLATMRVGARLTACRWQSEDTIVIGGTSGTQTFVFRPPTD